MAIQMLLIFLAQLIFGLPLFIAMLSTAFYGFLTVDNPALFRLMVQQFFGGMDVFALMAIPLFIFAGTLMNKSGLTDMLLDLSRALVGRVRGGLGYVNVLASILFAGVNGSAAADTSALGALLIPAMERDGYPRAYAAGLTAGSSLIGPIIPPSIFMILYASFTGTSVGGLFIAGVVPGLILGIAFLVMNYIYAKRYEFPYSQEKTNVKHVIQVFRKTFVGLVGPLIIVGGIISGVVTPTESGALAVAFILIAGLFVTRKLKLPGFLQAVGETTRLTSVIFVILGAATVIGWLLKWEQVPQQFASTLIGVTQNQIILMLIISGITFVVGMFMEEIAALALLTPVFTPLAMAAGIDPLQFGIVMTLNVTIALITPPMGACVFIVSAVGNVKLEDLFRTIWPFVLVAISVLLLLIVFPALTTALPRLIGLI